MKIDSVRYRQALTPRREPYWHSLGTGQHLGFRRTAEGGSWIARAFDTGTATRSYQALGDLAHLSASDRFTEAMKLAQAWFGHIGKGGSTENLSVRDVCARYVAQVEKKRGPAAAVDAQGRFARHVDCDPIAEIQLAKLTIGHVGRWRERLESKPATLVRRGPHCKVKAPQVMRPRAAASINRDVATLRAALNLALRDGHATSNSAWRVKLESIKNAGRRRTLYLTRDQRRALVDALPLDAAAFVHALCLLPLRAGAMAALTVGDFDARANTLSIGHDKAGQNRIILLPTNAAKLLRAHSKNKLPSAPLFARWDGSPWDKNSWKVPIRIAANALGLPRETCAYSLRHSGITDLTTAGLDLFTVAKLAGTSVAMIEKFYGHLRQEHAQKALAGLTL